MVVESLVSNLCSTLVNLLAGLPLIGTTAAGLVSSLCNIVVNFLEFLPI